MDSINILTIMLSWNRPHLLAKTIHSYCRTISVPHRLIVVDNGSDTATINCIKRLKGRYGFTAVFLKQNIGGRAFNKALNQVDISKYNFIHFSENDLEYHPGWDKDLLMKFKAFPGVGQLSPFSPFPQKAKGEIWAKKRSQLVRRKGCSIYFTHSGLGTTSIVRSPIIQRGLRWRNVKRRTRNVKLPADVIFSRHVMKLGWKVAWNDRYVATNWGHNIVEFQKDIDYYLENYRGKGLHVLKRRLRNHGYKLVKGRNGKPRIVKINQRPKGRIN